MAHFLAITSRGLAEPLLHELQSLDFKKVKLSRDAVEVEGPWSEIYRLHYTSRLTTRVLLPVLDFVAYNEDDLYHGIFRRHDFTQYIDPKQTFRIEARVKEHTKLRDQRFVAMKVKDAIADQFRAKYDFRPDVGDEENADLRVVVRVRGTQVNVAIDLTGEALSNRGYRLKVGEAPLRENLAAGLLRLANWTPETPLIDPFCGAGTILIEAASIAAGLPPVRKRRSFAFQRLKNYQQDKDVPPKLNRRAPPPKPIFYGFDIDDRAVAGAQSNAKLAGVENWIQFARRDARELRPPSGWTGPGMILTNPPYGERLGQDKELREIFHAFGKTLKTHFSGWQLWLLSGNRDLTTALELKAARRVPLWNGPIECRLLNYPLT